MTKVKDLQVCFPNTFKAITCHGSDNGMDLQLDTDIPARYIAVIEKAERAFADMAVKTLGDVVKVGDVHSYYSEDFQDIKDGNAFDEFVLGEFYFQGLISDSYGEAGEAASRILDDIAECNTDFSLLL